MKPHGRQKQNAPLPASNVMAGGCTRCKHQVEEALP